MMVSVCINTISYALLRRLDILGALYAAGSRVFQHLYVESDLPNIIDTLSIWVALTYTHTSAIP